MVIPIVLDSAICKVHGEGKRVARAPSGKEVAERDGEEDKESLLFESVEEIIKQVKKIY